MKLNLIAMGSSWPVSTWPGRMSVMAVSLEDRIVRMHLIERIHLSARATCGVCAVKSFECKRGTRKPLVTSEQELSRIR